MLGPMDKGWLDPNPPPPEDAPLVDDVSKSGDKDEPFWAGALSIAVCELGSLFF